MQPAVGVPIWVKRRTAALYKKAYIIPSCSPRIDQPSIKEIVHHEIDLETQSIPPLTSQDDSGRESLDEVFHYSTGGGGDSQTVKVVFEDGSSDTVVCHISIRILLFYYCFQNVKDILQSDTLFGHRDNASLAFLNAPNLLENISHRYRESFAVSERQGHIYVGINDKYY